ncbi:unnamed protein product [Adineta ricciae]|uniref:Uncharacterized protein n=1 Tax=Adineta ricciae TaxID=249248 RepID=A0A815JU69_ADIRI|nr:unnamed protein product [Adineta ricciae]
MISMILLKLQMKSHRYSVEEENFYENELITCPQLHFGIRSNENLFKENPKGILGLAIIGEHYPIEINDYIQLINYFQNIQWIYFDSIHITNQHLLPILHLYPLNSLKTLIYMRSTFCKIHRDFFEKLFLNQNNFKTLKIMYGDLIYYLKQSNEIPNGKHIENLVLFLCGADGQFRLIHLNYFILTFPLLKSLTIEINSKNLFRKNQLEIIKEILHSFQYLQSLKIICRKGNLHFTSSIISNLSQSFASFNVFQSHFILQSKYFAFWKFNSKSTDNFAF